VQFADSLTQWLHGTLSAIGDDSKIHVMEGVNSDSGISCKPPTFDGDAAFVSRFDTSSLFHAVATARVTKSNIEIMTMRYAAFVASNAHVAVMRGIHAGMIEYELEAEFLYQIYKYGGCRRAAYTSICACGPNGATLHYGHAGAPNDRQLLPTDMALLDQGADYHGYVSDITCSVSLLTCHSKII
jgi:Xaa-Pro dipeptidase